MEGREEIEVAAARWIARRDTGPWTPADAASLEQWLAASASRRVAYYRLSGAWHEAGRLRGLGATPLSPAAVNGFLRPMWKYAVVAAALLVIAVGVTIESSRWRVERYSTVTGGLQAVPLPDGSHVTLNTDSQLRVALNKQERLVELIRGEAYFEVAKDPSRPFVVKAGGKRIVAVGTQFSVLREGEEVRVIVSEGTVRLESDSPLRSLATPDAHRGTGAAPPIHSIPAQLAAGSSDPAGALLLSAGTVARSADDGVLVQETLASEIDHQLSWRNGVLIFRDLRLADAVAEFNRYNQRKIVIADPAIADLEVGGIFRSTNIEPFVHLLAQGFPVHETIEPDRIVLTSAVRR